MSPSPEIQVVLIPYNNFGRDFMALTPEAKRCVGEFLKRLQANPYEPALQLACVLDPSGERYAYKIPEGHAVYWRVVESGSGETITIRFEIKRVDPSHIAPAIRTGPSICSTGVRVSESVISKYSTRASGCRANIANAAWRMTAVDLSPFSVNLAAARSAHESTGAILRCSGVKCLLRELRARPSASRTVATGTTVTGTFRSATIR